MTWWTNSIIYEVVVICIIFLAVVPKRIGD